MEDSHKEILEQYDADSTNAGYPRTQVEVMEVKLFIQWLELHSYSIIREDI